MRGVAATAAVATLLTIAAVGGQVQARAASDTLGRSTLQQRITGDDPDQGFSFLRLGPGEPYAVRRTLTRPLPDRAQRRFSLVYFGQLSDFQLADEESPARVEVVDPVGDPFDAAWRPQEALVPHMTELAIGQLNAFVPRSPVAQRRNRRARMAFTLVTGDNADNQQRNETEWVVRLLEGGSVDSNSGSRNPADYAACPPGTPGVSEAPRYTGVQDYEDYLETNYFYDPDRPVGRFAGFPAYPGLMDRAQTPFAAEGLKVPSYVTYGNHDALVQGNQWATRSIEDVAIGCVKPVGPIQNADSLFGLLDPDVLAGLLTSDPTKAMLVPPDPRRQFVDKRQYKQLYRTRTQPDGHGFALVDPAESAASNGKASYYAFDPVSGFRFIGLDTTCDGGFGGPGAEGNIDDPQFRWLERELKAASAADKLIVLFGHHPIRSLRCPFPDEGAGQCTSQDAHGHGNNPGCDFDPRDSEPLHFGPANLEEIGADEVPVRFGEHFRDLLLRYPHMIAYVAGHTHEAKVTPFSGMPTGFWGIETASEADWPVQSRLLDVMDNRDGTLSIFGTILDHAGATRAPAPGTAANGFGASDLASIGRTLAYNDPARGAGTNEGTPDDRNVELLLRDPRRNPLGPGGTRCANVRGRIKGKRLHRAFLGRTRRHIRRSYPRRRTRGGFDYFCLSDGKRVRVGYPTRKLRRRLGRRRARRVRGRAVIILTNSRRFRIRRVRVGMRPRTMRRRLRGERRAHRGRGSTWYTARGKRATLIFRVRRGRVREIGIADRRLTRRKRGTRRLIRSYRGR